MTVFLSHLPSCYTLPVPPGKDSLFPPFSEDIWCKRSVVRPYVIFFLILFFRDGAVSTVQAGVGLLGSRDPSEFGQNRALVAGLTGVTTAGLFCNLTPGIVP